MSISNVNNNIQTPQDVGGVQPQQSVGKAESKQSQLGELKAPSRWALAGRVLLSCVKDIGRGVLSGLTLGMNFIVPDLYQLVKDVRAGKFKEPAKPSETMIEMQDLSESEKKKKAASKSADFQKTEDIEPPKEIKEEPEDDKISMQPQPEEPKNNLHPSNTTQVNHA